LHKDKARQDHADLYGQDQIEEHGQKEGGQKYDDVHSVALEQGPEIPPFAHMIGDNHQDPRQTGHGNQLGHGGKEQHDQQEEQGVHHPGNGGPAPILHIGRGPGYRPGGGHATKKGRKHIPCALGHQFHNGTVPASDHPIGDHGGQEGLDGAQEGNGDGRFNEFLDHGEVNMGYLGHGQGIGNIPELGFNGLHGQIKELHSKGGQNNGQKRSRNLGGDPIEIQGYQHRPHGYAQGNPIDTAQILKVNGPFFNEIGRDLPHFQTQEILDLGGKNHHGDSTGKPHDQGIGDEFQVVAQLHDPKTDDQKAGHEGGYGLPPCPVFLYNAKDDDDKGPGGTADLHPAAPEKRYHKTRYNGRYQPLLRGDPRGNGKGNGQGQGHDAHYDSR